VLTYLKVKNFAIIDDLELTFSAGLNVLTGETGAGKTILVNALKLILGERASSEVVRHGARESELYATFTVAGKPGLSALLKEYDVADQSEQIIIRRLIQSKGTSKIYINDKPVTLGLLLKISPMLVDICSQHQNQTILDQKFQLRLVDDIGNISNEVVQFSEVYKQLLDIDRMRESLQKEFADNDEKLDYLGFQLREIEDVDPVLNEDEEIEVKLAYYGEAKKLADFFGSADDALYSDSGAVISRLEGLSKKFDSLGLQSPSFIEVGNELKKALAQAEAAGDAVIRCRKGIRFDEEEYEKLSDRLTALKNCKRKYGGSLAAVIQKRTTLRQQIDSIEKFDETMKELEQKRDKVVAKATVLGSAISKKRSAQAEVISKLITQELQELEMQGSSVDVRIKSSNSDLSESGYDTVEFMFAPNSGEPTAPLGKIVSGGELSRVMLAVHQIFSTVYENS
jgi:DNA repair protein RecN (Recombination protein N)